jgi:hypothetical protein
MKLSQTIMGRRGIARVTGCVFLTVLLALAIPAHAQRINRTITITYTPAGGAPTSWEWRNMGTYFRAIAQMSTDPVALPYHATINLQSGDHIQIEERAQNGDIARTIILGHGFYRYTYYRSEHAYFKDIQNLGAGMADLYKTLPRLSTFNGIPPAILGPPVPSLVTTGPDVRALPTLALRSQMMIALAQCQRLSPVQVMNLTLNFDSPRALRVTLSPLGNQDPHDITFLDGMIRTRTSLPVPRLYLDRQGIWEAALAERPPQIP